MSKTFEYPANYVDEDLFVYMPVAVVELIKRGRKVEFWQEIDSDHGPSVSITISDE